MAPRTELPPEVKKYWMTYDEAAESVNVSRWTIRRMIDAGDFRTEKFAGRVLIRRDDVLAFVARLQPQEWPAE